jgi:glycosyltransferase involved in cell wall biosynthesis
MEQPKVIVLTCVYGRHKTVKKCLKQNNIETVAIFSTVEDGLMLKGMDVKHTFYHSNQPLSDKWNYGVRMLKDIDFDHVIMLGSDDYFNDSFLEYVKREAPKYDLLAFKDIYFEQGSKRYYWSGYECKRQGEPAGAGKVYSKKFLEEIDYNLFPASRENGLDGMSWKVALRNEVNIKVTSLHENGLFLCDVKDGEGLTPLNKIKGLIEL